MSHTTIFQVRHERDNPHASPSAFIEGRHRWALPNRIGCPDCTIYGAIGPAHPAVDLTNVAGAEVLLDPRPASWHQFQELVAWLRPAVPTDISLQPGTTLGPFAGKVRGTASDLVIGDIALLFVTSTACRRLADFGVSLPTYVPARLRARRSDLTELLEFDIPEVGQLALSSYRLRTQHPCPTCGRWDRELDRPIVELDSIPNRYDLVRPANHPTILLVSERFVSAVRALELTGVDFEPVESRPPDA